jgi:hypothetical protein
VIFAFECLSAHFAGAGALLAASSRDSYSGLPGVIGGAAGVAIMFALKRRSPSTEAAYVNGRNVVKYGAGVQVLFSACGFALLALGIAVIASYLKNPGAVFGGVIAMIGGSWIALEALTVRVEFDNQFLYSYAAWRRARKIPWSEVTDYAFSEMNSWHVFTTENHGKVRVSTFLRGSDAVVVHWRFTQSGGELNFAPSITAAQPRQNYEVGPFTAVLFGDIESDSEVQYGYILIVFDEEDKPCLYVTSEVNEWANEPGGGGSHFLGVFDGRGHANLGASDQWANEEQFTARALEIATERFVRK